MSLYSLVSRVSSVEFSVDELSNKADSNNAVLTGTTTINGPAFLNGPVGLGSSITGIDISNVAGLQNALNLKAPSASPIFTGTTSGITKAMVGLGSVDDTADADKPVSTATQNSLDAKADKANTYTKGDVDLKISNLIASAPEALNTLNELAQALASDPDHATTVFNQLATKASIAYVDDKLDLKSNQATTYTKTETDDLLTTKQNNITASTDLIVSSLTAQSYVSSPSVRATDIDFLGTTLTIKNGSTYFASMSASTGIKHFTYTDFNNNNIININHIIGVTNILGSGNFAATRGSFVYMSASGTTFLRPIAPNNQGVYIGQASSTSSGIEMTATGETTIDFSSPGTDYRGRIQYDNATNSFNFFANASATATLSLTSTTVTVSGSLTANNIYTKTETDTLLATKQPTITSSTNITVNKLLTRNIEPPAGFTDINLNANSVYFGNPIWLSATSEMVKFWTPAYFDNAIKLKQGLVIGSDLSSNNNTVSISFDGTITTQGTISCVGSVTAGKVISNTIEAVAVGDTVSIKGNWVNFGNGLTHTILGSTVSEFFSGPIFHQGIQVRNGIESGYYSASQPSNFASTFIVGQAGNVYAKGNITCEGILTAPNIYTKAAVEDLLANKLESSALADYYNKSYVDNALAGKQPTINMLSSLNVAYITATGLITAGSFSTTGTTNSGSINTGILFVSTLMQSEGSISVGTLTGSTWTDKCKLDANGDGTFAGGLITGGSISTSGSVSAASVAATGDISSNTMTTNTLTTAGAALNIKADLVLFKANDNTVYLEANANGVLLLLKDFYTQGVIKNKGGFSVGELTGVGVWTSHCDISSTGNISTNGTITSTGNITTTGTISSTRSNNTATNGGQIFLNGSTGNRIDFANNGMNPPAFTTRSTGTKICLWSSLGAADVDYAIGIESGNIWFSVPNTGSNVGFNWYGGTTRLARLNGSGTFDAIGLSTNGNLYTGGNTNQSGIFYIGTGGNFGNGRVNITVSSSAILCDFWSTNAGRQVGSISSSSGISASYNSASDYRLKENVKQIQNATEKVLQLKPCNFNFIGHEQEIDGFIAHELQEVAPYAVTGVKDAVNEDGSIITQQIDPSKLIALLTASLQELHEIVKAQQVQIDELRAQLQNHLLMNSATIIS